MSDSRKKRYSFAHVTTVNSRIDVDLSLREARKLESDGKLKYDGKVVQTEAVEHLFTPLKGCTHALLAKHGAN